MNYLVHLYLSEQTPECLLGNAVADFVKGPIPDVYPAGIRSGVAMHRKVDSFANTSDAFRRSKGRLDDAYGVCKSVLVDVFYDHFLAKNWNRYATESLEDFAQRVYRLLEENLTILPANFRAVVPSMVQHDWLVSYRDAKVIGRVLERISERISRPNPIGKGAEELEKHYRELENDFDAFLREAEAFVRHSGLSAGRGDFGRSRGFLNFGKEEGTK